MQFCRDILDEICDVFDSPYILIGGDECPKAEWLESQTARKQLEDIDGKTMDELQRWFTSQIGKHLAARETAAGLGRSHRRRCSGRATPRLCLARLDESRLSAPPSWAYPLIQAPTRLYFDYAQGPEANEPLSIGMGSDLARVYSFDPYEGIDEDKSI